MPWDKNLEMSQSSKVWHSDIWKCHKMSHFFKSLVQSYVYLSCLDLARDDSYYQENFSDRFVNLLQICRLTTDFGLNYKFVTDGVSRRQLCNKFYNTFLSAVSARTHTHTHTNITLDISSATKNCQIHCHGNCHRICNARDISHLYGGHLSSVTFMWHFATIFVTMFQTILQESFSKKVYSRQSGWGCREQKDMTYLDARHDSFWRETSKKINLRQSGRRCEQEKPIFATRRASPPQQRPLLQLGRSRRRMECNKLVKLPRRDSLVQQCAPPPPHTCHRRARGEPTRRRHRHRSHACRSAQRQKPQSHPQLAD